MDLSSSVESSAKLFEVLVNLYDSVQIARAAGITMQGRNEESKLFVGGLPWALDSEDLRQVRIYRLSLIHSLSKLILISAGLRRVRRDYRCQRGVRPRDWAQPRLWIRHLRRQGVRAEGSYRHESGGANPAPNRICLSRAPHLKVCRAPPAPP